MQLYLAASGGFSPPSASVSIAHAAYEIGADSRLVSSLPRADRSGLLLLSDRGAPRDPDTGKLCRDIAAECAARGFIGAVADVEGPLTPGIASLCRSLDRELPRWGLRLWVPEQLASLTRHASVLVCTALSGGSLRYRLQGARGRYGDRSLALDCQRLAAVFLLPSPIGESVPLTPGRLAEIARNRSIFFARDLCAKYFTYTAGPLTHFVLFDDADTLRRKAALGTALGCEAAFYMLPEVENLLERLFPEKE